MVLQCVKIPAVAASHKKHGRPLAEIVRAPKFIVAVACGVVAYGCMNLVMTSAPLAMVGCGHSVTEATLGIQWHVMAMYAPSFFTGSLIARFGTARVTSLGFALLVVTAVVGITGVTVAHFWADLVLLGVGWNFAFIGATTMVTQCHRPEERNKVQAFNDFLIFGGMAVASSSSGVLLADFGWATINEVIFPTVLIAAALLLWLGARERRVVAV
jgi:predicted MFS family arabinose efflux permease